MTHLQNGVINYFSVWPPVDALAVAWDGSVLVLHDSKLQSRMKDWDVISIAQENTKRNINCLHIINLTRVKSFCGRAKEGKFHSWI